MATTPPPIPSGSPASGWVPVNTGGPSSFGTGGNPLPPKRNKIKDVAIIAIAGGLGAIGMWLLRPTKTVVPNCPPANQVTTPATPPNASKAAGSKIHKHKDKSGATVASTQITPTHIKTTGFDGLTALSGLKDIPDAARPAAPIVRPTLNSNGGQQAGYAAPPPPDGIGPDDFVAADVGGLNTRVCETPFGYGIPCGLGPYLNEWGVWGRGGAFIELNIFFGHHHRGGDGHLHYDGPKEPIRRPEPGHGPRPRPIDVHAAEERVPMPQLGAKAPIGVARQPTDIVRQPGNERSLAQAATTRNGISPSQPNKYEHLGTVPGAESGAPFDHRQSNRESILSTFSGETGGRTERNSFGGGARGTERGLQGKGAGAAGGRPPVTRPAAPAVGHGAPAPRAGGGKR